MPNQECQSTEGFTLLMHIQILLFSVPGNIFIYFFSSVVHTAPTILRSFFRDHPGEPVAEENFWTLWRKGRLTEADTLTIRLGATPSGLTSAHLHHPPIFFTCRMPFLPPNQQHQSTEGSVMYSASQKTCPVT